MGQNQTTLPEAVPLFSNDENFRSLISTEILTISYEQFLQSLGEINRLCQKYLDSNGKQLVFAVRKGTDSTVFWKATVEIACVKIQPGTQKVDTFRIMHLNEFLKVFKNLTCQFSAAKQSSDHDSLPQVSTSDLFSRDVTDSRGECCICMDRQPEVSLPCAHSYCHSCIKEWNESHDTCPICRDKLESSDDTWVISEVPKAEEISAEIRANLSDLTNDRSPPCSPS